MRASIVVCLFFLNISCFAAYTRTQKYYEHHPQCNLSKMTNIYQNQEKTMWDLDQSHVFYICKIRNFIQKTTEYFHQILCAYVVLTSNLNGSLFDCLYQMWKKIGNIYLSILCTKCEKESDRHIVSLLC